MRFLISGCGSIGERHLRNLQTLGHQVIVHDTRTERLLGLEQNYNVPTFRELERALEEKVDGVLVCTPTAYHVPTAMRAVDRGFHVFVEKPLSNTLEGTEELVTTAARKGLVTLVGYNLRFFRSLRLAKKLLEDGLIGRPLSARAECGFYLPYWHPWEDYRGSYSANAALGGGVVLDHIHELDYLRWFLGEVREVFCFADKLSTLEIDTEDLAEILLRFESGAIAEIHLDYLQRSYRRSCEIIGEDGVIVWDYIHQTVQLYGKENNQYRVFLENINTDRNEMYIQEMEHFVRCIQGEDTPVADAAAGRRILEIALAAQQSAREGRIILTSLKNSHTGGG